MDNIMDDTVHLGPRARDDHQQPTETIAIAHSANGRTVVEVPFEWHGCLVMATASPPDPQERYNWRDERSHILRMLHEARTAKEKAGWSRNIGTGFIGDDLISIHVAYARPTGRKTKSRAVLDIQLCGGSMHYVVDTSALNLRETDECIAFMEKVPEIYDI